MSWRTYYILFWGAPFFVFFFTIIALIQTGAWVLLGFAGYLLYYFGMHWTMHLLRNDFETELEARRYDTQPLDLLEEDYYDTDDPFLPDDEDSDPDEDFEGDGLTTQFRAIEHRDGGPEISFTGEHEDGSEPGEDIVQELQAPGLEP